MQMRHKKIVASEAALITKQQNEMSALKKKLEGIQVGQMKSREQEHNKYNDGFDRMQVTAEVSKCEEGVGESAESGENQVRETTQQAPNCLQKLCFWLRLSF